MLKQTIQAQPLWRDRVIDFRRIPARDLQAHDGNWRQHPSLQQEALLGTLREIGIAGALLVYHSPAHDGALVTIDGHLRKALDPEQIWPCLVLDVDDAEAAYILATHDPISAMAEANADVLARLLSEVQSSEAAVQAMLSELAEQEGISLPEFAPDGIEQQGNLGQTRHVECPQCGYTFTP